MLLQRLGLAETLQYTTFVSGVEGKEDGLPTSIDPEEFARAIRNETCPCIGAAISKDIKNKIIPFVDELHESAAAVNSVNTITNHDRGTLVGYNTDYIGFRLAIADAVELKQCKRAVVYGYGGVSYVVCKCLESLGIAKEDIFLSGRNLVKAGVRAEELGVSTWAPNTEVDIFVNSAPVTDLPLEQADNLLTALRPESGPPSVIFDHEMPGKCLRDWVSSQNRDDDNKSITYISGYGMYYPQMKAQWKIFLRKQGPSEEEVDAALEALINEEKD